jgi:hypothetical protein
MDELGLYVLYFCTGKANQNSSQGPKTMRHSALVAQDKIHCPKQSNVNPMIAQV